MVEHHVPGAAVGIVKGGKLAWSAGFGFADLVSRRPCDEHTLFQIGSITKTFTAAAILQLCDWRLFGLDEPLGRYIGEFRGVRNRFGTIDQITLRRLLTHHSGLVDEPPTGHWKTGTPLMMADIMASIPRLEIAIEPDSAYKYSNLGYAFLGELVARVSGRPYADYVCDEILRPLGMESSCFRIPDTARSIAATGYASHPYEDLPAASVPWDEQAAAPSGEPEPAGGYSASGGLRSSVADLARWISFQFSTGEAAGEGARVLSERSLREMHRVYSTEPDWKTGYCLAWSATRIGDDIYLHHGGAVPGFLSFIAFNKLYGVGVIALTNSTGHFAHERIGFETLETIVSWEKESRADAAAAAEPVPTPEHFRPFLGRYHSPLGDLQVEFRNGQLMLASPPGSRRFARSHRRRR